MKERDGIRKLKKKIKKKENPLSFGIGLGDFVGFIEYFFFLAG